MRHVLTLVARDHDTLQAALPAALEAVVSAGHPIADTDLLGEGAMDLFIDGGDLGRLRSRTTAGLRNEAIDFCVQPAEGRRKRLLVADMDSTIVGQE